MVKAPFLVESPISSILAENNIPVFFGQNNLKNLFFFMGQVGLIHLSLAYNLTTLW
jgi:hypothetical protein